MALSDYTQLEYIESTGTQYINTNYYPNGNMKYELEITNSSINGVLFGAYNTTWTDGNGLYTNVGGGNKHWIHYYSNTETSHWSTKNEEIVMDKGNLTINGVRVASSNDKTFNVNNPLYIFAGNMGGNIEQRTKYRLHYFKMYDNNTLVRDFSPVKRKSDNVLGLYDKVNNVFYTNAGTGTFIAGPIKDNITNYQKLEYIESTGTQYIDTKCYANIDTKIEMATMCTATTTSKDIYTQILGGRNEYHASSAIQIAFNTSTANAVAIDYGTGGINNAPSIPKMQKFTIQVANNNIYIDNVKYQQRGTFSGVSQYSLWLFDDNDGGKHESYYVGRVYYCKIYNNNTLIKDFIPVKRKNDNVIGLFDIVNNRFYTNLGTGSFIAGPNKYDGSQLQQNILEIQDLMNQCNSLSLDILGGAPKPDPLKDYKKLEYIQSTGSQYINTDINIGATTDIEVKFITVQAADGYGRVWGSTSDMKYELADTGGNTGYRISINGTGYSFSTTNDIKIVKMTGNGIVFLNNSQIYNFEKSYTGGEKLWLFWGNSGDWKNVYSRIKLYYAKVWQDNKLVRNYMPVLRKEDNKVGLFDIQNNQFYIDVNNGNFTAGPEIN